MKLEDILKARGFTDADLTAAATLLGDQRFRGAIETHMTALQTERDAFATENQNWVTWNQSTNAPRVQQLVDQTAELTGRSASLEARLRAIDPSYAGGAPAGGAPERGGAPAGGAPAGGAPAAGSEFDPKKYNLLTEDDASTFAVGMGDSIAIANNLAEEYRELTGNSMFRYEATIDGRLMRGMVALREEAKRAKQLLPDFIESKFDFSGKRAAAATKAREEMEAQIRLDERKKVMGEMGNPNARPLMPSAQPFIPRRQEGGGEGSTGMPWDNNGIVPKNRLRSERLNRFMETQVNATVQ